MVAANWSWDVRSWSGWQWRYRKWGQMHVLGEQWQFRGCPPRVYHCFPGSLMLVSCTRPGTAWSWPGGQILSWEYLLSPAGWDEEMKKEPLRWTLPGRLASRTREGRAKADSFTAQGLFSQMWSAFIWFLQFVPPVLSLQDTEVLRGPLTGSPCRALFHPCCHNTVPTPSPVITGTHSMLSTLGRQNDWLCSCPYMVETIILGMYSSYYLLSTC